uniref:G-protein coupled receptors family 1 profile domain-containing protein n=1 Tax=Plectus sambesii TaxID=2011161 RepID=A0A914W688_9BILA
MNSLGSLDRVSIRARQLMPQLAQLIARNHTMLLLPRVTGGIVEPMTPTYAQFQLENGTAIEDCSVMSIPYIGVKFYLLAVFGTALSIFSLLNNSLLFYMFASRESLRGHYFYLMALALLDIGSAVAFVFILSLSVIADYYKSFDLLEFWAVYFRFGFSMGHVILASSAFLIMLATVEKFVLTIEALRPLRKMQQHRPAISLCAILVALIVRGTIYWEVTIERVPECEGFGSIFPAITALTESTAFNHIWRFWVRSISSIFIPFFVMVCCNAAIICNMRQQLKSRHSKCPMRLTKVGAAIKHHQQKTLRTTTRVIITIVSAYLLANALSILITSWEYFDPDSPGRHPQIYSIGSDIVSLATVFTAVIRLPIYAVNNSTIRLELFKILHGLFSCIWLRQPKVLRDRLLMFSRPNSPFFPMSTESEELVDFNFDFNSVMSRQRVTSNTSRSIRPKHSKPLRSGSEVSRKFGRYEDIKVASMLTKDGVVASGIGQIFMQISNRKQLDKDDFV